MSYFEDASLVLIPSGIKDQKVYSIKPTDGSGDLTFSRGSDIEATRIGADGYIQKAKVNLLLQSNTFSTSWTNNDSTETGGQSGYDGSSDAWLLTATGTASTYIDQALSLTAVQTLSVYAKAGTASFIELVTIGGGGANPRAWFNLSSGSVGTSINTIDTSITSVGGGWYRCSITLNANITNYRVYLSDADGSTAVTNGAYVYIQDAQLNYGLVAQTYQETTTAAVVSGITDNMPRLNYDPANPTCPSLLLEPSRTNHYYKSEYFSTGSRVVFTQNAITSPEGVSNGTLVVATSALGSHEVTLSPLISIGNTNPRTFSVYAKYNGNHLILNVAGSSSSWTACIFDLENGVAKTPQNAGSQTACTADIQDAGGGWYRCSITYTPYASGGFYHLISLTDDVNATLTTWGADNYTGDDVNGIYIYGAQVEEGSYPTSYIPTYGSSATRTADACSKTGISSLIGQTEGTLFYEFDIQNLSAQDNDPIVISAKDSGGTDNIYIQTRADGGVRGIYYAGGAVEGFTNSGSGYLSDGSHKIALGYKANDFVLYIDGVQVDADTSGATSGSFDELYLGYYNNSFNPSINSKQALLFTSRLSNADLATLTTL